MQRATGYYWVRLFDYSRWKPMYWDGKCWPSNGWNDDWDDCSIYKIGPAIVPPAELDKI